MDTAFFIENMVELLWQDEGIDAIQKLHDHIHDAFRIKDTPKRRAPRKKDPQIAARQEALKSVFLNNPGKILHISEMDRRVGYTKASQRSFDLKTLKDAGVVLKVKKGYYRLA